MNRPYFPGGRAGARLLFSACVVLGAFGLPGCDHGSSDDAGTGGGESTPLQALLQVAVRIEPAAGEPPGWGVVLDVEQGLVLTAGSAVGTREEVRVTPADTRSETGWAGRVVFRDPDRGLAVVRLDGPPAGLSPLPFGGDTLQPSQVLYAVRGDAAPAVRSGSIRQVIQLPHLCGNGPKVIPWVVAIDPDGPLGPPGAPVVDGDGRLVAVVADQDDGQTTGPAWLIDPPAMRAALAGKRGSSGVICPTPTNQGIR